MMVLCHTVSATCTTETTPDGLQVMLNIVSTTQPRAIQQ